MVQPEPIEAIAAGLRNLADQVSLIVNIPTNGAALADRVRTLEQRSNASDHMIQNHNRLIQNHNIMLEQFQSNHLALMARFEKLDQKIDTFNWNLTQKIENLDKKIDTVNGNLGQKIDNIHRNLDQKIDTVHQNLDQKIDTVDAHVDKIQRDLSALHAHEYFIGSSAKLCAETSSDNKTLQLARGTRCDTHPVSSSDLLFHQRVMNYIHSPVSASQLLMIMWILLNVLLVPQCIETAAILNLPILPPNTPVATRRRAIAQYLGVLVEY